MAIYAEGPDGTVLEFPDDATDAEMAAALDPAAPAEATKAGLRSPGANRNRDWLRQAPTVGGAVGQAVGGRYFGPVGQRAGAALGGGIGKAAEIGIAGMMGERAENPVRDILGEGAMQAALAGGGQLLTGAAKAGGKLMMKRALGPTTAMGRSFGDIPETLLRERIPVTAAGEMKASQLLSASSANTWKLLSDMDARGLRIRTRTIALAAINAAEKRGKIQLSAAEKFKIVDHVRARATQLLEESTLGARALNPPPPPRQAGFFAKGVSVPKPKALGSITPTQAKVLKDEAFRAASTALKAEKELGQMAGTGAIVDKAIGRGVNRALKGTAGGEDVLRSELRTQKMLGAETALKRALNPASRGDWTPISVGPLHLGMRSNPAILSNVALGVTDPRLLFALGQMPRLGGAFLQGARDVPPDTTGVP